MFTRFFILTCFFSALCMGRLSAQFIQDSEISIHWTMQNTHYCIQNHDSACRTYIDRSYDIDTERNYTLKIKSSTIYKVIQEAKISVTPPIGTSPLITQTISNGKLHLRIYPLYRTNEGKIALLSEISLRIVQLQDNGNNTTPVSLRGFKKNSVLKSGDFYKIGVKETGPIKLSKAFFDAHDIPVSNPQNIQIWGQSTGMLPFKVSAERTDDLTQLPVLQHGLADGVFNKGDYLVFYAMAAERVKLDETFWNIRENPFSSLNYYFIRIGKSPAKKIKVHQGSDVTGELTTSVIVPYHHERADVNLLEMQAGNSGSGLNWYGELLNGGETMDFSNIFDDFELIPGSPIHIRTSFAGRHSAQSYYKVNLNGNIEQNLIRGVALNKNERSFARLATIDIVADARDKNSLRVQYDASTAARGWIDYVNGTFQARLTAIGEAYRFSMPNTLSSSSAHLQSTDTRLGSELYHLWNISDPTQIIEIQPIVNENTIDYDLKNLNAKSKLILFNSNNISGDVQYIGKVKAQNLHSIDYADMIIITHRDFLDASNKLAEYRRKFNGFTVKVVEVDKIYNEFSSGRVSPTAIRDFLKMVYERSPLKYVLLMGDATFDYRNLLKEYPDQNFIPAMQSRNSTHYIASFPYDDYYALLDDDEGDDIYGDLDIAIGRIPAKTAQEASDVVDKIIHYESDPQSLGDWRLTSVFIGDDESNSRFMKASNRMADRLQDSIPAFNLIKIFLDAFKQESFADGDRYPEATKELNNAMLSGCFIVNYVGHGGPSGWSQERVLTVQDMKQWDNYDKLPLFITATCTFSAFDNPGYTSGGERLLLKGNGGAIALYSTTRTVYDSDNRELANNIFNHIYKAREDGIRELGEILRIAKNSLSRSITTNSRKFMLLGDPAMKLAMPQFTVKAKKINSIPLASFQDTLSALEKVTIEGEIQNNDGEILSGFNGILVPALYDKPVKRKTLGQDPGSEVFSYKEQKNVLFKGKVSIKNGKFKFSFILPKDIEYRVGYGKLSFYAYSPSDMIDAMGLLDSIKIGGISEEIIVDNTPPHIKLFLNDTLFVDGDYTNSDPMLIAYLSDRETGINVAGQSIGHDLVAYLDDDVSTSVVLNQFYTSELDKPRAGSLRYHLSNISPGEHSLTLEAWDLSNNKSSATIHFTVTEEGKIVIMDVNATPNPFTESTTILIKHNLAGKNLTVTIPIYDAAGRLIYTIEKSYENAPATIRDIRIDAETFPTMPANMYFYTVILEHRSMNGKIIRIRDNDNKLIHVN